MLSGVVLGYVLSGVVLGIVCCLVLFWVLCHVSCSALCDGCVMLWLMFGALLLCCVLYSVVYTLF